MTEDEREFNQLRQNYRSLPQAEPGELTDARIRAAARQAVNRRSTVAWTGAIALAASIAFGVVVIPSLLVKQPEQALRAPAEVTLYTQHAPVSGTTQSDTGISAEAVVQPPEPAAAPVLALEKSERYSVHEEEAPATAQAVRKSLEREAAARNVEELHAQRSRDTITPPDIGSTESAQILAEMTSNAAPDFDTLRAELDMAPEREWRTVLIELRDHQQRLLAEKLMPEYRRKFDLPESLTLDQLVASAAR